MLIASKPHLLSPIGRFDALLSDFEDIDSQKRYNKATRHVRFGSYGSTTSYDVAIPLCYLLWPALLALPVHLGTYCLYPLVHVETVFPPWGPFTIYFVC